MVKQIFNSHIEKIEHRERKIFWSLFSMFVLFVVSYGFLLNGTMMNAVSKQNAEKQISVLNSEVNTLEFQYLNIKNSITLDLAESIKGFVPVKQDKFAIVNPNSKGLSLSVNEN